MATSALEGKIEPAVRRSTGARIALALGACLLILALAALGYELVLALETGSYRPLAAGELWYALDRGSLNLVQAVIQRYVHPALWDPLLAGLLHWPAWSLLGAPGAALLIAFAPGRPARRGA
ncbi:MAG: hypothetical protein ACREH6_11185 [Geminicoccaceae bacterium]